MIADDRHESDRAPGDDRPEQDESAEGLPGYLIGLGLAVFLTCVSFFVAGTTSGVGAQHSGRALRAGRGADGRAPGVLPAHHHRADSANNVMALAFGVLIVLLVSAARCSSCPTSMPT